MMRWMDIFLLSGFLSIARTNDIRFYYERACDLGGDFHGCSDSEENTCCSPEANGWKAVSVSIRSPYQNAKMFTGGGCTTPICSIRGVENPTTVEVYCCIDGISSDVFTGGRWFSTARRKRNGSPLPAANCTDTNVFGYASSAGAWEIRADDMKGHYTFGQLREEFQTIASHDEKITWLQAHDAAYKAQLHDRPVVYAQPEYP